MEKNIRSLPMILLCCLLSFCIAQKNELASTKIRNLVKEAHSIQRITFREGILFNLATFFKCSAAEFEMEDGDELLFVKQTTDETSGLQHYLKTPTRSVLTKAEAIEIALADFRGEQVFQKTETLMSFLPTNFNFENTDPQQRPFFIG